MVKNDQGICVTCGATNLPGTLFCKNCGTYLASGGPLRTEMLSKETTPPPLPRAERKRDVTGKMLSIEAEILNSGRKVLLPINVEIVIGRLDAARGIFPELDLTLDDGLEMGVSRRHARLFVREGTCYVEDLGGDNGTFVNDNLLVPRVAFRVLDGDVLTLGMLQVKLHIYSQDTAPENV